MQMRLTRRENAPPELSGHIAVFNQLSDDLGGFRERIRPGAFATTIKTHDIRCLWNHENDLVLGRNKAGTLHLEEDEVGLLFRNDPPDTTWFRDRAMSIERGDVTGCSFAFLTDADEWSTAADGTRVRDLIALSLFEVSPGVTFPAYPQTDVALRSLQAYQEREKLSTRLSKGGQSGGALVDMELRRRQLRLKQHALTL